MSPPRLGLLSLSPHAARCDDNDDDATIRVTTMTCPLPPMRHDDEVGGRARTLTQPFPSPPPFLLSPDGAQHKNLRIFSISTGKELIPFTQKSQEGWDLQYTISESHAIHLVSQEFQVFRPVDRGTSMVSLSLGLNPSVAVCVAKKKKGAPASIKIYGQLALSSADRAQIKWNDIRTQTLVVIQTEIDKFQYQNISYCGETSGPNHDVAWGPNTNEFGVVYGFVHTKTILFDQRVRHDFGSTPHNTMSFNPQGSLLFLTGFGNLAGKIVVFDRRTLNKVCTLDAPNTFYYSWSPDGRFLLTATLFPCLRVDNRIKIWHAGGPLIHVQAVEELYQVSWHPTPVDQAPPFGSTIPPAPQPSPHRKDEGGEPRVPGSSTVIMGSLKSGMGKGTQTCAWCCTSDTASYGRGQEGQDKKRKKKEKKGERGDGSDVNGIKDETVPEVATSVSPTPGLEQLDSIAKKVRNLNKKLKEKAKRGERLEVTQLKNMEREIFGITG
ncbi:eIF2A-domain-containing protein [Imleria badia]|nr:eIF2A-domain-containing protein [Imleria badia]